MVGAISYAALSTRPDICSAAIICAKFAHNPGRAHLEAAKRILRYLAGTSQFCLVYRPPKCLLTGFVDSDWAGDPDSRKSTSGYVFLVNNGPVSWKSKQQKCIAQSSAEAEYVAANESAKEVKWLRRVLKTLLPSLEGGDLPTRIRCDSSAAIGIIENPICSSKAKHIELRYHFVRSCNLDGTCVFKHITTNENVADILTKPLPAPQFKKLRNKIMGELPKSLDSKA